MKIYQFGKENQKIFVMFECTAEPWWVFKDSCSLLAKEYRVLLFIADGHDELGTTFVSLEKNVRDAANWLTKQNITYIDAMYGVSMGGASVIRFLATEDIPVKKAIIDAGITPYPYPKPICRMIAIWDFLSINLVTKNYKMMKIAAPPQRWTPKNEDPEEHYQKIFEFEKNHYSPATIYNVFWTTNNYDMPDPMPIIDTKIEYWYGEKEKRARKNDIKYTCKVYPQTVVKEFKGLAHAELVLMHPQRFYEEVKRFMEDKDDNRHDEIQNSYRRLGSMSSIYDGMITRSTMIGKMVDSAVWDLDKEGAAKWINEALSAIPEDFSGKLLEVPIGTGVLTMPLYASLPDADITCLDYSKDMMEAAKRRAEAMNLQNITFVQGDVGHLPFEDESFDIVLSLNGFHAFPDKEAAFKETYRVLKPGGIFCGCFYIAGEVKRTDWFIEHIYVPKGFFTPPFETKELLEKRLKTMYSEIKVSTVKSEGIFCCKK